VLLVLDLVAHNMQLIPSIDYLPRMASLKKVL
jgi:hypothetical protein